MLTEGVFQEVPAAPPQQLDIPALGLSTPVETMATEQCPVLDPPTVSQAYWVQCRAQPGTDTDGTVFVIGHSVGGGQGVFDTLPELTAGSEVTLRTEHGWLVYRVEQTALYEKYGEAQRAPELRARVPGRLVLVTCFLDAADDRNFVVYATLVSALAERGS